ncbi:WD40 repeat-like protein, partial [Punctularia strigosozonata HHB-11173 SS5]|uniref:WD40 repeat-like protein n=1 Tax=Punctularia strigosozonata (strain HHB-11173) TaxID=741275 RepID=UPI000441677B
DPFNISYPSAVQNSLGAGAIFSRYDTSGRFIVAGRNDGSAAVWDLDTRSPIRWLEGHVKGVTHADWSRNSRYLLTTSKDWNVVVWDLAADFDPPQRHTTVRFDAPVLQAYFHPRNRRAYELLAAKVIGSSCSCFSKIMVVLLTSGDAYLVDLRDGHSGRTELLEVQDEVDEEADGHRHHIAAMTAVRFDPSGKHIFVGTSNGSIIVFNTRTKTMVGRHRSSGGNGYIKGIEFVRSGRRMVTNSSDRTIRQFNVPTYPTPSAEEALYLEQELEPTHRFNDPINRTAWHAVAYSPDGEWLAGGAADPANHKIYIWDISNDGQFAATLDGGREPLTYIHWHPSKSAIASTTNQGTILIWHCPTPERWGAFAGGFEEVDENVEYEEREDEFDIEDEAEIARRKQIAEEFEVDIDGMNEEQVQEHTVLDGDNEEDSAWAEEDADDDVRGWKMKTVMEEETDFV